MKQVRTVQDVGFRTESLDTATFAADPALWFLTQAQVGEKNWLLVHALNGIIWGSVDDGQLHLSSSVTYRDKNDIERCPSPPLLAHTLLEARLFGQSAQVHLWSVNGRFSAMRISDRQGEGRAFEEDHHLWGTQAEGWDGRFTILNDGREGHVHAVPLDINASAFERNAGLRYRPVMLRTRHYLGHDKDLGQVTIVASRLVGLVIKERGAQS